MELELEATESHDGDRRTLKGVLLTNLSLKQLVKLFGKEKTMASATAEMQQIHWRNSFVTKHYRELTQKQKSRMVESFQFFKEKSDRRLKDRLVLGGNVQHVYITKDEASSPV